MKTLFESEKEAQEALEAAKGKCLGYCPIINSSCMKHCICYYKGAIQEPVRPEEQKGYWTVYYPGCTNVLMSGIITVEQ